MFPCDDVIVLPQMIIFVVAHAVFIIHETDKSIDVPFASYDRYIRK